MSNAIRVVVATHNEGKLVEIRRILQEDLGTDADRIELVTASSLNLPDPVEDGVSFEQNALLKARDVVRRTGLPAIADDSGLIVDILGSAPGILSARWAGVHGDDKANYELLLGDMKGMIIRAPRGENGFGYDPIFVPNDQPERAADLAEPLTSAELTPDEKNAISHRSKAIRRLIPSFRSMVLD